MLKHIVEGKLMLLDVFCEVDLFLEFLDGERISTDNCKNIFLIPYDFFTEQGSLTYDNTNLWRFFLFVHLEFVSTLNIVLINLKLYFTSFLIRIY